MGSNIRSAGVSQPLPHSGFVSLVCRFLGSEQEASHDQTFHMQMLNISYVGVRGSDEPPGYYGEHPIVDVSYPAAAAY